MQTQENDLLSFEDIQRELNVSRYTLVQVLASLNLKAQQKASDRRFRGYPRAVLPEIAARIQEMINPQ